MGRGGAKGTNGDMAMILGWSLRSWGGGAKEWRVSQEGKR